MRILVLTLTLMVFGCSSAPKQEVKKELLSPEKEKAMSTQLTRNLNRKYGQWRQRRVQRILDRLVSNLILANKSKDQAPQDNLKIKVHLLRTRQLILAAGLNKTIYVSRGALRTVQFENELAFMLGTQISLIKNKVPQKQLQKLHTAALGASLISLPTDPAHGKQKNVLKDNWFNEGGFFDFGEVEYIDADREGIRIAYMAKFDPRGAPSLLERWNEGRTGKIMPNSQERLRYARDEVAKLSPLRDPIVKSKNFDELQRLLEKRS